MAGLGPATQLRSPGALGVRLGPRVKPGDDDREVQVGERWVPAFAGMTAGGGGGHSRHDCPRTRYVFIDSKKSPFVLVWRILSIRNSIASTVPIGLRMRRSTYILRRMSGSTSSSSLRVPDLVTSIAGKMRLSETLRSSTISQLPVPLNSSKITSSMRLPVSISAVEIMVSEPPSSMLRAAPKKRLGRCSALASTPPVSTLPELGTTVLLSL